MFWSVFLVLIQKDVVKNVKVQAILYMKSQSKWFVKNVRDIHKIRKHLVISIKAKALKKC